MKKHTTTNPDTMDMMRAQRRIRAEHKRAAKGMMRIGFLTMILNATHEEAKRLRGIQTDESAAALLVVEQKIAVIEAKFEALAREYPNVVVQCQKRIEDPVRRTPPSNT